MSNIALSWAFRCHVGNASAKAVLVYLADRASDDGTAAFPKIETIVNVTELSERTVRSSLKTLQERGFIRRGDQRYARLGKGGRNRLPQYCQVVWDLAVESDPATLEWIKETHAAEQDPSTMSKAVDPTAGTVPENDESKDVLPETIETKPIPSTANLAGLEKDTDPALQIPHTRPCKSRTSSTANAAGLPYKDKTLQVNPPCEPNPSLPTGELPASGKRPTGEETKGQRDACGEAGTVMDHLASVRSKLALTTAKPTKRDLDRTTRLVGRVAKANGNDHAAALALILAVIDWLPANTYWLGRIDSARRLADNWEGVANDWTISRIERQREHDAEARNRYRQRVTRPTPIPDRHEERHMHSLVCEHVLNDMRPHEAEYDHEGSLRYGKPSEWQTACMRHADELNRRDGIEVAA